MEFEAVVIAVFAVFYLIGAGVFYSIKALYRLATGAARREREERQRQEQEWERQKQEREQQKELRRQAIENAMRQFEEAVMEGRFPSDEVLTVLKDCHSGMPVNLKEAVEELLWDACTMWERDWSDAVARIQQHQRTEARARARAARGDGHGFEASGPISQNEAYKLLGVCQGCTTVELVAAYRRTISQWHPDKLDSMADELKAFATQRTARINEAYQILRHGA